MISQQAMANRSRCTDGSKLLEALAELTDPDEISYRDDYHGVLNADVLMAHSKLLRALLKVAPTGAIVQSSFVTAIRSRFKQCPDWHVSTKEAPKKAISIAKMLRAMLRDVDQSRLKASRNGKWPPWLLHILGPPTAGPAAAPPASTGTVLWKYKFCSKKNLAFRDPANGGNVEWASTMDLESLEATAVFKDSLGIGHTHRN